MKIRVTIWNSDRREILTVGTFLRDNMTRKTIKTPNKSYLRSSHKYQRVRPFQNILNSTINHKVIFPRRHLRLNDHQPILHWSNVILEVLNFMLLLNPPIRRGLGDCTTPQRHNFRSVVPRNGVLWSSSNIWPFLCGIKVFFRPRRDKRATKQKTRTQTCSSVTPDTCRSRRARSGHGGGLMVCP